MNIFLIYLLKVNIALSIVFALYLLLFKNNTLFQSKRIFLWIICTFTLAYPFISVPIGSPEPFLQDINYYFIADDFYFDDANIPTVGAEAINPQKISFSQIIFLLYIAVTLILTIRFFIQCIGLIREIRKGKSSQLMGHRVTVLPQKTAPFSFFSRIVIDQETSQGSDVQEILTHEQTHVDQKHSIDVIFSEIYTIFCWFNPLTWLLRKEIRLNLEYLADASVIRSGYDAEKYQFHILRLSYPLAIAKLHTGFNFSPLKKRIKMMNTKKSPTKAYIKYILFIPVVAALLLLNQKKMDAMPSIPDVLVAPIENLVAEVTVQTPTETKQTPVKAKQEPAKTAQNKKTANSAPDKKGIYEHVEQMPEFPGGDREFLKFVQENLRYPIEAQKKGIQGTVRIRFVVEKDGSIGEVQITRSLDPECDQAAAEAIKKSPKWIPGKAKGQDVSVWYNIPVRFELSGGDNTEKTTNAKSLVQRISNAMSGKATGKEPLFIQISDNEVIIELEGGSYKVTSYEEVNESGTKTNKIRVEPVDKTGTKSAANISHKVSVAYVAKNGVYDHAEKMPAFPGGDAEFLKFVQQNLTYPIEAQKKGITGTVRLRFVVKKDGSIGEVQITRSLDPECDEVAADAVKKSPKWFPGEVGGNAVDVWYNIPVRFELE